MKAGPTPARNAARSTIWSPAVRASSASPRRSSAHFPDARTIVLSSDILGGVRRLRLELEAIAKGEADIVIGTQLVAKGHNFPNMTLVGVVDADLGLANGDPRAAERTFQLLSQVTGRAGRTGRKSVGLLQTYPAGPSGDARDRLGRFRELFTRGRSPSASARTAAVRPAGRHHRQRRRRAPKPKRMRAACAAPRRRRRTIFTCLGRPRRRWR